MPHGVVAGDRDRDAFLGQLVGGEPCALEKGPRLVGDDLDALALLEGGADDAKGRAVAGRGQGSGVAVGHDGIAVGNEFRPVLAHGLVDRDILDVHVLGRAEPGREQVAQGGVAHLLPRPAHARDGPTQVDGRRPGLFQIGEKPVEAFLPGRLRLGRFAGGQIAAVGGRDANGRRAANHHGLQGIDGVGGVATHEIFLAVRQKTLVEQEQRLFVGGKGNVIGHLFGIRNQSAKHGSTPPPRRGGPGERFPREGRSGQGRRLPCPGLPLPQLLAQKFVDQARIGLSLGGFHDLADEKSHELGLAAPVGFHLGRVAGKHGVHGRFQG